ncbi:hypothetical protein [Haloarchaeobius sp. HRN-SO-5]|uniref:hypothetical protein n=1 Tax=Haloarchaeobius sp. HRN-SO-5 TaxID=3446118 RepID=UPI003EBCD173
MSDLVAHMLGFRRLLAAVTGLGLLLLALLATFVEGRTATIAIYVVIASVVMLAGIAVIYLRILSKESADVRDPPPEWERTFPDDEE